MVFTADIAHELDEAERQLMLSQGTETADAIRYIAEGSNNVDESGNFSLSVLNTAVQRSHDLSMSARGVVAALENPTSYPAYILNLREHWFCGVSSHINVPVPVFFLHHLSLFPHLSFLPQYGVLVDATGIWTVS